MSGRQGPLPSPLPSPLLALSAQPGRRRRSEGCGSAPDRVEELALLRNDHLRGATRPQGGASSPAEPQEGGGGGAQPCGPLPAACCPALTAPRLPPHPYTRLVAVHHPHTQEEGVHAPRLHADASAALRQSRRAAASAGQRAARFSPSAGCEADGALRAHFWDVSTPSGSSTLMFSSICSPIERRTA